MKLLAKRFLFPVFRLQIHSQLTNCRSLTLGDGHCFASFGQVVGCEALQREYARRSPRGRVDPLPRPVS